MFVQDKFCFFQGTRIDTYTQTRTHTEFWKMPVCSGLSALIQAATSQLGHLVESDASELSHPSPNHFADGYASSSDGDWRASTPTPTRTPTMVPEDSKTHKTTFPELLMTVLVDHAYSDVITFLPDGKFFAVRVKEFSDDLLHRHFRLSSYDEFLELLRSWGFVSISSEEEETESSLDVFERSIQVFRHPHFRRGGVIDSRHVRFTSNQNGEPNTMPTTPQRPRIEHAMSDDSSTNSSKRRLSPSHIYRDFEDTSQKQKRVLSETDTISSYDNDLGSIASHYSGTDIHRPARRRSSLEIRSKALAVTAAQLSLDDGQAVGHGTTKAERRASLPLIDGGVDKATHNIVADAIETLLFDEPHTREMYLRHERELSTSTLPGVVPISKQLFSPQAQISTPNTLSRAEQVAAAARALHPVTDLSNRNPLTVSPTQLEAAAALVKQAGLKEAVWAGHVVPRSTPP